MIKDIINAPFMVLSIITADKRYHVEHFPLFTSGDNLVCVAEFVEMIASEGNDISRFRYEDMAEGNVPYRFIVTKTKILETKLDASDDHEVNEPKRKYKKKKQKNKASGVKIPSNSNLENFPSKFSSELIPVSKSVSKLTNSLASTVMPKTSCLPLISSNFSSQVSAFQTISFVLVSLDVHI